MADIRTWTRSLVATTGAAIAGPAGAIIGAFLGSIIASLLPGQSDFTNQVLANLSRMSIDGIRKSFEKKLTPQEKQRVNSDLQMAFRDAIQDAFFDIGGPESFPQARRNTVKEIPEGVSFFMTAPGRTLVQRKSPLTNQVADCLQTIVQAINAQAIFPIDSAQSQPSASVYSYLEAETPDKLAQKFFDENISPVLKRFSTLQTEIPELEPHLRRHLFERTLIHLNEYLKNRTPAWRAFNRLVLDNMQAELSQLVQGQSEILDRLKALNDPGSEPEFNGWSDQLVEILTATTTLSKNIEEGFEALGYRVVQQHKEVITRLDALVASSNRIEKKVDRVLRFLGEGKYVIEGEATNPYVISKPPAPGEAPYKGLQNFTQNDAELFFGRDDWIAKIITRLRTARFLAIIGASGSGKSSVVRAGILPVLKKQKEIPQLEFLPANSHLWPMYVITPSAHPLESLATILAKTDNPADFRAWTINLHHYPHVLDLTLRQQAQKASADHVLLVVDQFEEVFTQCQSAIERADFIRALMDAADPSQSGVVILIIILRADFYAQCAEYEQLRSAISQYQEYIGPMSPEEIRQAIEAPAAKLGWRFEPGLIEFIIKDAGNEPGILPLLSHALLETWRNRSGHTMTLESYAESGGVKGAIAKTAEMVYQQQLSETQQGLARNILLRLTNLGEGVQDTRRRSTLAELIPSNDQAGAVAKVVNLLAEARLLTIEDGAVDVAHEALIREWPTLRTWIEENRADLRIHQRLSQAAQEWQRFNQDNGLLYRGLRLQEALEWSQAHSDSQNSLERTFIQTSQNLEQREAKEKEDSQRRELETAQRLAETERHRAEEQHRSAEQLRRREYFLRIALAGAGFLAVIAVIFAVLASLAGKEANDKTLIAQTASTRAVAEAETRATAEANAINQGRISQVREIAARVRNLLNTNQEMAILVGVQAVKLAQSYGLANQEAQSALYLALNDAKFSLTLHGHTDTLTMARFSPDGQKIVTASRDQSATIWGSDGRRLAVLTGHTGEVTYAVFSPDGKMVVTAGQDGTARVWQTDGKLIRTFTGHQDQVNQAMFSPDSNYVLTVSNDRNARVWDVKSGNNVMLLGHSEAVLAGAFSPDNLTLATTSADGTVRIWRTDGTPIATLTGHTSWVVSAEYSSDGKSLLTGSWDKTARIWKMDSENYPSVILTGHKFPLNFAAFSPDGSKVVTAGTDNLAKIWTVQGALIADLHGHTQQVNRAIFSPDSTIVMTAGLDNTVRMWQSDGTPLAVLRGHSGFVYDVSFSPDGSKLVTASADLTARIWQTSQLVQIFQDHYGAATTAAFSTDGNLLLTGSTDGVIRLHRKDGVTLNQFYTGGPINKAVFSSDSRQILVASNKNVALLYNLKGEKIVELVGHTAKVNDAHFSPDGAHIITASADGNAILWQKDGKPITTLSGHTGPVTSARFSPDGTLIVTASDDRTIRFWKSDGTRLPTVIHAAEALSNASFSPDGTKIIAGCWDSNAYLWGLDGKQIAEFKGHTGGLISAEFSPDGKMILTASVDGTARLWTPTGGLLASLEGHTSWVNSADFSFDSQRILTTSWDGTARVWDGFTNQEQMVADSAKRVGRTIMTQAECQIYLYMNLCP